MRKIFTSLLTLALLVSFSWTAHGQAADDFNYPVGDTLNGKAGGSGWSDAWFQALPGTIVGDPGSFTQGGIVGAGSGVTSSGNALEVDHKSGDSNKRFYRGLPTAITDDGNSYWLSFFMESSWPTGSGAVSYVMLMDTATLGPTGPGGQLLQFGRRFNNPTLSIARGGAVDDSDVPADEGHWVVVRIVMSGDAENETIYMWADPDPNVEPDTTQADKRSTNYALNDGFNGLGIKVEGGQDIFTRIDEIRFGPAYTDVVAGDLTFTKIPTSEKFNQTAGTPLTDIDQPGDGWGSGWISRIGPDPVITETGIENFNIFKQTSGNKLEIAYESGDETRVFRALNTPYEDDGNTYYLSFSTKSTFSAIDNGAFLMLVDTATFGAGGPGGQLVSIGKVPNQNLIGLGVNFNLDAQTTASADEGAFIVARIDFSGDAEPDTISIYVNPDPDTGMEPAMPDATRLFTNLNNGFDGIGFKVGGNVPGITSEFDDILLGETYGDVIPQDFIQLFDPVTAFAYDKFSYPAGEELTGQGVAENGWAEPWQTITPADSSIILPTGLLNNALGARSTAESVELYSLPGGNRIQRLFEDPIDTTANSTFWMAAQLRITGSIAGNVGTVNLVDTSRGGPQFQQAFFGKRFGSPNIFAGGFGSGGDQVSGEDFDLSTANWVVIRMDRSDSSTWAMDLWVDPDPGTEPMEADAQIQNKIYTSGNFHGVMLKSEGAAGVNFSVDDLLLGNTFTDIVPQDLIAIPPLPGGASDNFNDYMVGSDIEGQNMGDGWAEDYNLITGTSPTVSDQPLTNFFILKETSGNSLEASANVRMARAMEGTYGDVGRTFWLGWFFRTENGGPNVAHLVLADTATYEATGPGGQLVQIGKGFGGNGLVAVASPGGPTGESTDTVHFIVAEIVTNGTADPDDIYIWVDPDLEETPIRDSANVAARASLTNWNAIGFKVEGDPGVTARWDDIILASTFDEVIPTDLTDVAPPEIPQVAVETFDYTAGEDLAGQDGGTGWGGPWAAVEGSTVTVGTGSIPSDRVDAEGNKAELSQSSTPVSYDRPFFATFGTTPSTVWTSFLLNVGSKDIGNTTGLALVQADTVVFTIGGVAGLDALGVTYNGGTQEVDNATPANAVYWVVARIEMNATDDPDKITIWTDPASDAIPVDDGAVFTIEDINLNAGFDGLRLFASGAQSAELMADEFRIGFSFRDISNQFGSSDPDLIAYEPFNYDAGADLVGAGGINAFWDGTWTNEGGNLDVNTASVIDSSLTKGVFESVGRSGRLQYLQEGQQIRIDRKLAFPLESDGGTYWLSFLQFTPELGPTNNVGNVMLVKPGESPAGGQRLAFGRMFGGGKIGIISPVNNQPRTTDFDDVGLNWLVAKIVTTAGADRDTVFFWVNPDPQTEPDTADADLKFLTPPAALNVGIDVVRLKAEGAAGNETPYTTIFDELRLATTFQSASTPTNTIEPSPSDPFQLSAFPNPARDQLTLTYALRKAGRVRVSLFDLNGRLVRDLFDGQGMEGENQIQTELNAGLENGIYFVLVQSGDQRTARKLIILR